MVENPRGKHHTHILVISIGALRALFIGPVICVQLRNAMRQAYVRAAQLLRVSLCSREENRGSKFHLLFEAIFKDLALGSWLVLAVAMFYWYWDREASYVASGSQTPPTLPIDTMLPATWLGSRTFCIPVYMHQSIVHMTIHCTLISFVHYLNLIKLMLVGGNSKCTYYALHES